MDFVANFQNFTSTLVIIGVLLAIGIIFEKRFLALEDKFDAWFASKKPIIKSNLLIVKDKLLVIKDKCITSVANFKKSHNKTLKKSAH